jgi:hypothetical protein
MEYFPSEEGSKATYALTSLASHRGGQHGSHDEICFSVGILKCEIIQHLLLLIDGVNNLLSSSINVMRHTISLQPFNFFLEKQLQTYSPDF